MSQPNDVECAVAALALRGDLLDPESALRLITQARTSSQSLESLLIDKVGEVPLLAALASEVGYDFVDLFATGQKLRIDDATVRKVDLERLKEAEALPLVDDGGRVVIAMANPRANPDMLDYLRAQYGQVGVALAPSRQLQSKLVAFDSTDLSSLAPAASAQESQAPPTTVTTNPVVEWVDQLMARAAAENASDVHLRFNLNQTLNVRFRVNGDLYAQPLPAALRSRGNEIVGTLLAKCETIDPADRRMPQDGKFSFYSGDRTLDARVSLIPMATGPSVVARVLDPRSIQRRVDAGDFSDLTVELMKTAVAQTQGMVLMVGPTGSGKTTLQYTLMNEVDKDARNVITVEDPVEYSVPGVGQVAIREGLGDRSLTFDKALRAILRHDPDVILVGEIRDRVTASVAMHAATTGHMVMSTLHTNSALGVMTRLGDLDIEPFAIAEALSLAVSQRLIYRLHECKTMDAPTDRERALLNRLQLPVPELVAHANARGCSGCRKGIEGRFPVVEVLAPSEEVRTLIGQRAPAEKLLEAAQQSDTYSTLVADGYRHVLTGSTTVGELIKCLGTGGE